MKKEKMWELFYEREREKESEKKREKSLNTLENYGLKLPLFYLPFLFATVLVSIISTSIFTVGLMSFHAFFLLCLMHFSSEIFDAYLHLKYH